MGVERKPNNYSSQMPLGQANYDPSHKVRLIIDLLNEAIPNDLAVDLTTDESMIGFELYTCI